MTDYLLAFFDGMLDQIPPVLLWFWACIGHGFLWMTAINLFYALAVPHKIQDFIRRVDFLTILAGPVVFVVVLLGETGESLSSGGLRTYFIPYICFCFLLGLFVAPIAQILYWMRRPAPQLVERTSQVVDFTKEFGYPPRGTGKRAATTLLPGNQVFQVEFVELTLRLPQLPAAWDGLSILHLTDLHFHAALDRKFYQAVIDRAMGLGTPDLVCITGDIVDSEWHHRWILPVLGRLRWNVAGLFILGNHDVWWDPKLIRRRVKRLRMHDVGSMWKQIDVRGQPMVVVGHEGPWIKPLPNLETCPPDIFRLCLSHSPDAIGWARKHQIDLMLAGHVHGGQIRFPWIGSLFVPSRHSRKFDCGTFFEEPTVLHVGRGLAGKHPLRINCRPEVTRIVLRRG